MIGGVNSYGSYGINSIYTKNSQMNNMRLTQALSKNPSVSAIGSIGRLTSGATNSLPSNGSVKFVRDFQKSNTELMSAANALRSNNRTGVINSSEAYSSDSSVATVSANSPKANGGYSMDVLQLATAQQNVSSEVSSAAAPTAGGELSITTGKGSFSFNADSSAATNADMYASLAAEINQQNIGVTASVTNRDGKTSLTITGNQSGADQGFIAAGSFAGEAKLNNVAQSAGDALVSVSRTGSNAPASTIKSSTNTVSLDNGRISATLTGAGKTNVSVGPDGQGTTKALEKLVSSYNDTLKLLSDNSDRGAGVMRQMKRMALPSDTQKALSGIGITTGSDGTLSLDKEKLQTALSSDPNAVQNAIGGVNGLAERTFDTAVSASQTSAASLLGNGATSAAQQAYNRIATEKDPMNTLNSYSKSGVYNLSNLYAVGVLMNINI